MTKINPLAKPRLLPTTCRQCGRAITVFASVRQTDKDTLAQARRLCEHCEVAADQTTRTP